MRPILAGAVALALSAGTAAAASLPSVYSSLFVFGDSLSDTGNVFAATPNPLIPVQVPTGPYVDGRFSNGDVWADRLIDEFRGAGRPAFGFAFGLANAGFDGPSVDLSEQIGLFDASGAAAALGSRPLAALWFGANDIFAATDAGLPTPVVESVGAGAAQAVAKGVVALSARGISDFLVFNLPDLGRTPAYATADPDLADEATAGAEAFNATLPLALTALPPSLNVTTVDVAALFDDLLANPVAFGLSNATDACYPGDAVVVSSGQVPGCSADVLAASVFFDNVHPTTAVHARIADAARATLGVPAPVPLPAAGWLLAATLAGLAVARRRA